jgi:hypothetical protein
LGLISGLFSIEVAWFIGSLVLTVSFLAYFALWRRPTRKRQAAVKAGED